MAFFVTNQVTNGSSMTMLLHSNWCVCEALRYRSFGPCSIMAFTVRGQGMKRYTFPQNVRN